VSQRLKIVLYKKNKHVIILIMFIKKIKRKNGKISLQIVATQRLKSSKKIAQKVLKNIGTYIDGDDLEAGLIKANIELKDLEKLEDGDYLPFDNDSSFIQCKEEEKQEETKITLGDLVLEQNVSQGVIDIFGHVYDELGFSKLINKGRKKDDFNNILKQSVLMRIHTPSSKRKISELLEVLTNQSIGLHKIYRMLSRLQKEEDNIKNNIFNATLDLFNNNIDVAFFDVTTLYFESFRPDELRNFGFSKDCKFKEVQIVLALITTTDGMPLGYELFEGNKSEGGTLISSIKNLKKSYKISNIFLVADRAMFTEANLKFLEEEKVKFIVAAKLKSLPASDKENIITFKKSITKEYESKEFEFKGRRLIVSYSKDRAEKDKKDRERLVARLKKYEKDGVINLKDIIKNNGTKKYLFIKKDDKTNTATINTNKIEQDALWDGIHGVITNDKESKKEDILEKYKGLWQIEAAFRINKNDLKMRPVFHWKPDMIRAHILFCYIAYSVVVQVKYRLNKNNIKMSFERIKEELSRVQTSILRDKKTNKKFALPKVLTETQEKLYKAFSIKYSDLAYNIN
jgi:transposase